MVLISMACFWCGIIIWANRTSASLGALPASLEADGLEVDSLEVDWLDVDGPLGDEVTGAAGAGDPVSPDLLSPRLPQPVTLRATARAAMLANRALGIGRAFFPLLVG
jgi:hypothetical protein